MHFFDKLRAMGDDIQLRFPLINQGGCCVYAALVGRELQRMEIPVRGFVGMLWDFEKSHVDKARRRVSNPGNLIEWINNGVHFHHVGLEIIYDYDDYHVDTDRVQHAGGRFGDYTVIPGRLTLQEVRSLASATEGWSENFNRKDIPKVKKLIRYHMKKM